MPPASRLPLLLGALLPALLGAAPPDKQACVDAHLSSQELRGGGKLREARERLMVCSLPVCPQIARDDCAAWLAEVERDLPSVLLRAKGSDGGALGEVRVKLDGVALREQLDEAPVPVDPGTHTFRFEAPGKEPAEQSLKLGAGEKNRLVSVTLAPAPRLDAAGEPSTSRPSRALGYVVGAVGVLGLAGFGYFGLSGRSGESALKSCRPLCAQGDVDAVLRQYLFADVALGVGVLAAGVSAYLLLRSPPRTSGSPPAGASGERASPRVSFDLSLGASQATGLVRGSF